MNPTQFVVCVGVQKAGTTLLYDLLKHHPMIDTSQKKELHYFDRTEAPDYSEYLSLFENGGPIKLDATPAYIFVDEAMQKIYDTLPQKDTKLIVLLRDPVKRAHSHYYMSVAKGRESHSFEEAFELEHSRMQESDLGYREFSYFQRSKYYSQVKTLLDLYPREQIKFVFFEEFIKKQQDTIDEICDFIGIERIPVVATQSNIGTAIRFKRLNKFLYQHKATLEKRLPGTLKIGLKKLYRSLNRSTLVKEPLSKEFENFLQDYFREDLCLLEKFIEIDLTMYLQKNGSRS